MTYLYKVTSYIGIMLIVVGAILKKRESNEK